MGCRGRLDYTGGLPKVFGPSAWLDGLCQDCCANAYSSAKALWPFLLLPLPRVATQRWWHLTRAVIAQKETIPFPFGKQARRLTLSRRLAVSHRLHPAGH